MPRLSRLFIRFSLLYQGCGFTLGGLMLANKGIPFAPGIWRWLPAHIEFLLAGWLLQLAMGVAFWILPRLGPVRPRGDERLVWAAFLMVNLGIWLVVAASVSSQPSLAVAGRLGEAAAGLLFALGSWRRVRPFVA